MASKLPLVMRTPFIHYAFGNYNLLMGEVSFQKCCCLKTKKIAAPFPGSPKSSNPELLSLFAMYFLQSNTWYTFLYIYFYG